METRYSHETMISPFTWRYGTDPMRSIWSEQHKRLLLRRVWVALAEAQQRAGIVRPEQVEDLKAHQHDIDIDRASEIEAEIHHDLMAEIRTYAEQCPVGGSIIHLGATSMDALDNVDALRLKEALGHTIDQVSRLVKTISDLIRRYADYPCMAFTHLQPAEPTTLGYRFAQYGQDLASDLRELKRVKDMIKGKGMKVAVGTSASYGELLQDSGITPRRLEEMVMESLGLEAFEAATQVYPRKQDLLVVNALASCGATLYKMAFDLRVLQSPPFGEWSEPFGAKQVGSSAMPFKRNPIRSEKIDSLARYLSTLPSVAWDNAAHCLLERTLDDSANRRIYLPEAFLTLDEILETGCTIFSDIRIYESGIAAGLADYGIFAATERVLMELGRRGADRQEMHEVIRKHCIAAWAELHRSGTHSLGELLSRDPAVHAYISEEHVLDLLDASRYVGDAQQRAIRIADDLDALIST